MVKLAIFVLIPAVLLVGCGPDRESYGRQEIDPVATVVQEPSPAEVEMAAKAAEEAAAMQRVNSIRQANPEINWMRIGISTGKFSESLGAGVFKTYDDCMKMSVMEDNECVPITALPKSYWNAEDELKGSDNG